MPRWILVVVAVLTVLTVAMVLAAVQLLGSGGPVQVREIRSPSGGATRLYTQDNPGNEAVVGTDPATGERVLAPRAGLEGYKVPEFTLVDQAGRAVTEDLFEGKITILNFMFTNCVTACPPMTANTLRLYNELKGADVQFVSVSVDPAHDTPERLAEYAGMFGIDHGRWTFLTGTEGEASRVCNEALRFDIQEDADESQRIALADGSTMSNILHPIKLFLVGPDRQILDFCAHQVESDRQRFAALARRAAE